MTGEPHLRGALASIIADPDCCATSKAIARDALTYHAEPASADDTSGTGHTPRPIGYASAEHLSRRTEYERNGLVIYATPCGTSTLPLFAGPPPDLDRSMKVWAEAGADLLEGPPPVVEAARQTARIYLHAGTTAERAHANLVADEILKSAGKAAIAGSLSRSAHTILKHLAGAEGAHYEGDGGMVLHHLRRARAAIAKARGEA